MKILAVDDQKLNLIFIENYIQDIDPECEIILCQNPLEAELIVTDQEIDIILLDIIMTPMTGIELLKRMRALEKLDDVPILMFSSMCDSETIRKCFDLGANDYLSKPINEKEFNARVRAVINSRKAFLHMKQRNISSDTSTYIAKAEEAFEIYDLLCKKIQDGESDHSVLLEMAEKAVSIRRALMVE